MNKLIVSMYRSATFSMWFSTFVSLWCFMISLGGFAGDNPSKGYINVFLGVLNGFLAFTQFQRIYLGNTAVSMKQRKKEYNHHVETSGSNSVKANISQIKTVLKNISKENVVKLWRGDSFVYLSVDEKETFAKFDNDEKVLNIGSINYIADSRSSYEKMLYFIATKVRKDCEI